MVGNNISVSHAYNPAAQGVFNSIDGDGTRSLISQINRGFNSYENSQSFEGIGGLRNINQMIGNNTNGSNLGLGAGTAGGTMGLAGIAGISRPNFNTSSGSNQGNYLKFTNNNNNHGSTLKSST
jgi:hypothetical protein